MPINPAGDARLGDTICTRLRHAKGLDVDLSKFRSMTGNSHRLDKPKPISTSPNCVRCSRPLRVSEMPKTRRSMQPLPRSNCRKSQRSRTPSARWDRRYVNLTTHYDTDSADVLNQDTVPTRATRRRGQAAGTSVHIHESSFRETCFARQINHVAFLNIVLGRQHRTSPSQLGQSPEPVLSSRWSRGVSA